MAASMRAVLLNEALKRAAAQVGITAAGVWRAIAAASTARWDAQSEGMRSEPDLVMMLRSHPLRSPV
eukprot:3099725-Pleurochrysis_carterae.AAC.1